MRCLVTGASGFIGQHLVKALEARGDEVTTIPHDFLGYPLLLANTIPYDIDYIFALHAYGNMSNQKDETSTLQANIIETYNLLQATKRNSYKAFINVSSSSVLLPHQTMYSATKMGGEYLCKAFADEYDKPIVTARLATVIGKGEQESHLIPTLIRSCETGEEMPFVGTPTHDFINVRDVVEALLLLADNAREQKGKSFNVSGNHAYPNSMIKQMVEEITGRKANSKETESLRSYDVEDWRVDNSELTALSWKPRYSLFESIAKMIDGKDRHAA